MLHSTVNMRGRLGIMAISALVAFGFAAVSEAADPKPKTVVNASVVQPTGQPKNLEAAVYLEQQSSGAPPAFVNQPVKTTIEIHYPTSSGQQDWIAIGAPLLTNPDTFGYQNYPDPLTVGSQALVTNKVNYTDVCKVISDGITAIGGLPAIADVNSIRVVGVVTVNNAQKNATPDKWVSKDFLGRSISMSNPCR